MTEPLPLRRRRLLQGALAAPLLPALARPALAQGAWPSRTVRVIVPFPASGATDLVAAVMPVLPVSHPEVAMGRSISALWISRTESDARPSPLIVS